MRRNLNSAAFLLLLAACFAPGAQAQTGCSQPSPDCVEVGQWDISLSLGGGIRTNPVESNGDIPLVAVPQISYYGERFFLENLELGFTLHETDSNTFNLVTAPGYDRVFFFRNDLQNIFIDRLGTGSFSPGGDVINTPSGPVSLPTNVPVRSRRTTYLAGPEWSFGYGRLIGQLSALYEVTGRHKGTEVRAAMAAPIFRRKGQLALSGGFTWKSAELVRYYYGVENVYKPDAAFNPFVKMAYERPLSERWTFRAFAHYEYLDDAVADSPIVSGSGVTTMFVGFAYKIF